MPPLSLTPDFCPPSSALCPLPSPLPRRSSIEPAVGELINVIALAIQKRVTVRELDMIQIATHPLLTAAPTVHPLINASHQALAQMRAAVKE